MAKHGTDQLFGGSIPLLYETHLVPLIFEPYAARSGQDVGCACAQQRAGSRGRYGLWSPARSMRPCLITSPSRRRI